MIPKMTHIAPPIFGGAEVAVDAYLVDPKDPQPATGDEAAAFTNFMALGPDELLTLTPHVLAYAQDFAAEARLPERYTPEDLWSHVTPNEAFVEDRDDDWYVCVEADCDWEPEHGLMLVWHQGRELVKVGPFDGQLDHEGAEADVIYHALDPKFTTRRG